VCGPARQSAAGGQFGVRKGGWLAVINPHFKVFIDKFLEN
jgi:hypothetical protein